MGEHVKQISGSKVNLDRWAAEWTAITTKLNNSGIDLSKINIVPKDDDKRYWITKPEQFYKALDIWNNGGNREDAFIAIGERINARPLVLAKQFEGKVTVTGDRIAKICKIIKFPDSLNVYDYIEEV